MKPEDLNEENRRILKQIEDDIHAAFESMLRFQNDSPGDRASKVAYEAQKYWQQQIPGAKVLLEGSHDNVVDMVLRFPLSHIDVVFPPDPDDLDPNP